jgi:hypothetical protein
MQVKADRPEAPSAIRSDLGAIFVSLELTCLIHPILDSALAGVA